MSTRLGADLPVNLPWRRELAGVSSQLGWVLACPVAECGQVNPSGHELPTLSFAKLIVLRAAGGPIAAIVQTMSRSC